MKMMATIELEFESGGEATYNAMDQALIRGMEGLKKGIELRETARLGEASSRTLQNGTSYRESSLSTGFPGYETLPTMGRLRRDTTD